MVQVAQELGVGDRLQLHVFDAFDPDLPATLAPGVVFDFIWIDLGAAHRLGAFFEGWWPRLCAAGGHVAVHSTLTNQLTRDWLERIRTLPRAAGEPMGEFEQARTRSPLIAVSVHCCSRRRCTAAAALLRLLCDSCADTLLIVPVTRGRLLPVLNIRR